MPLPLARYRKMHERGSLPTWCSRVIASRPIPIALWGVVLGVVSLNEVGQASKFADLRRFDDHYWRIQEEDDDPMNEYRQLMRNELGEAQIHAHHRSESLRAALRYRLNRAA